MKTISGLAVSVKRAVPHERVPVAGHGAHGHHVRDRARRVGEEVDRSLPLDVDRHVEFTPGSCRQLAVLGKAERADLWAGNVERRLFGTLVRWRAGARGSSGADGDGDGRKQREQDRECFHQGLLTGSGVSGFSGNCAGETPRDCGTAGTAELPGVNASSVDASRATALVRTSRVRRGWSPGMAQPCELGLSGTSQVALDLVSERC